MEKQCHPLLEKSVRALSSACEEAIQSISCGEMSVKEIRELTTALKELNNLCRTLNDKDDREAEDHAVTVSFDEEGEGWSK